jgi:hypothetical protein
VVKNSSVHIGRNSRRNFFDEFFHRHERFEFYILHLLPQATKQPKVWRCYILTMWSVRRNLEPASIETLSIDFWKVRMIFVHMNDRLRTSPNPSVMSTFLYQRCQHMFPKVCRIKRVVSFYPVYYSRPFRHYNKMNITFSDWIIVRTLARTSSAEEAHLESLW